MSFLLEVFLIRQVENVWNETEVGYTQKGYDCCIFNNKNLECDRYKPIH